MQSQNGISLIALYLLLSIVSYREHLKKQKDNQASLVLAICWSISAVLSCSAAVVLSAGFIFDGEFSWLATLYIIGTIALALLSLCLAKHFKGSYQRDSTKA